MLGRALLLPIVYVAMSLAPPSRPATLEPSGRQLASITGTVYDSLVANGPLASAEVVVQGTDFVAVTDPSGRFRIDSVPAGRSVLRFYHPTLDSLGFAAAP